MIVRDEEKNLPACLESVKDLVDEIVIADTGSKDGTVEVAQRFGARCISIPWENNFAAARNRSLEEVHSDWVLWMDADEQLDDKAKVALPRLIAARGIDAYIVPIFDYVLGMDVKIWDYPTRVNRTGFAPAERFPAYVEHINARLFHRCPELYFVGCIHESVWPRLRDTRAVVHRAGFVIHHFGIVSDPATRIRKNLFYRQLLQKKVQDLPNDAQSHLELGLAEMDVTRDFQSALQCFAAACRLNPRLGTAWLYQGLVLRSLGRPAEALEALRHAKSVSGQSADLCEGLGDAYYDLQDFHAARRCYKRALSYRQPWPAIESKLGLTEVRLRRTRPGLERLRQAVEGAPWESDIHDRLIQACCWLNMLEEAANAADHKLAVAPRDPLSFLRAASIHAQLKHLDKAVLILRVGLTLFPGVERLQRCYMELSGPASQNPT
jgi:tetratricopeptide (TPR) repeat protein